MISKSERTLCPRVPNSDHSRNSLQPDNPLLRVFTRKNVELARCSFYTFIPSCQLNLSTNEIVSHNKSNQSDSSIQAFRAIVLTNQVVVSSDFTPFIVFDVLLVESPVPFSV